MTLLCELQAPVHSIRLLLSAFGRGFVFGAVGAPATAIVLSVCVPAVMALTGTVVPDVGTIHGPLTPIFQQGASILLRPKVILLVALVCASGNSWLVLERLRSGAC